MNKLELAKSIIDENFKNKKYEILNIRGQDEFKEISPFPIKCSRHLPQMKMERKLTIEISYYQCLGEGENLYD